ncbi:ABC-type transport auxiliary lipoprotein family protein [endosymbiont of Lamellibrachia barhami]|uniref:ABC-type transport auxiliary lipoprotein family protein n=1 Tax=endosymbiont of Lamellibrachia barhami TaxID=205975 RepID=UPI0015AD606C|nr:ABC-type transport auxiliary lipoprotein family protein [endosymbiont of Lamellibrachia barhami]
MNRLLLTWGCCIIALIAAGCASTKPVPENNFYRLVESKPQHQFDEPQIFGSLIVDRIKASGILSERALLYSYEVSPEALMQHHYHHWTDSPASLIREQFVTYLRNVNLAQHVASDMRSTSGDYHLRVELKKFERMLLKNGGVEVRVTLRMEIISDGDRRPLFSHDYSEINQLDNASVLASVRAMNEVLSKIYSRVVVDLINGISKPGEN